MPRSTQTCNQVILLEGELRELQGFRGDVRSFVKLVGLVLAFRESLGFSRKYGLVRAFVKGAIVELILARCIALDACSGSGAMVGLLGLWRCLVDRCVTPGNLQ